MAISEAATARIAARDAGGKVMAKLSEDDWDMALDRIANGDLDSNVMKSLGVTPAALHAKRHRDPEFAKRYADACEAAYLTLAHDIRSVTRGVEGYSSGDVRRDELIARFDHLLAKSFAAKILGDKPLFTAEKVTIQLSPSDTDLC